ncbi:hypothetical protein LTR53_015611 [Teratosphaeriaceae sp. CCFEE 6253]|nr:hypothetical protein LTR53_015611 [Teratosphaeriaceae sp. CCFEE 6253]
MAVIKTYVIRIQGPKAKTMRRALIKRLKHTANKLDYGLEQWGEDMSANDRLFEEELVEAEDGTVYVAEVDPYGNL